MHSESSGRELKTAWYLDVALLDHLLPGLRSLEALRPLGSWTQPKGSLLPLISRVTLSKSPKVHFHLESKGSEARSEPMSEFTPAQLPGKGRPREMSPPVTLSPDVTPSFEAGVLMPVS
jgi:hypothetical protein